MRQIPFQAVLWAILLITTLAEAQPGNRPAVPLSRVEQVTAPADKPQQWPAGDWQPVTRDEWQRLQELLAAEAVRPRECWIERAVYRATFEGDTLRGGTMEAVVRNEAGSPRLISLDPLNLAVGEFSLDGQPAIWGTRRDGRTALYASRPQGSLSGRWTLQGRTLQQGVEFDVQVSPAVVSQFELRLPAGYVMRASAGEISAAPMPDGESWNRWTLELGSRTGCRIVIRPEQEPLRSQPRLLASSEISYVIRPEGLQFQAEFAVEVFEAPVNLMAFALPVDVDVYSLTYGLDDTVSWRSIPAASEQRLMLQLADPLIGVSKTIRIQGFAPANLQANWKLPAPVLQYGTTLTAELQTVKDVVLLASRFDALRNAAFLDGFCHLRIAPPLELHSANLEGFRQVATASKATDGDANTYLQYLSNARLAVDVRYPEVATSAEVKSVFLPDREQWLLRTEIQWTSFSGSTFLLEALLADEWDVFEVSAVNAAGATQLANWKVEKASAGRQLIRIELLDALAPSRPRTVRLQARRLPPAGPRRIDVPFYDLSSTREIKSWLYVQTDSGLPPRLAAGSTLTEKYIEEADRIFARTLLPPQIPLADSSAMLFYRDNVTARGTLLFDEPERPFDATAWVSVQVLPERVAETVVLTIHPRFPPVDRIEVLVAPEADKLDWSIPDEPTLLAEANPRGSRANGGWDTGTVWELKFRRPQSESFQIVGTRVRPARDSFQPCLAVVLAAREFQGIVEVLSSDRLQVHARVDDLQPIAFDLAAPLAPELRPAAGPGTRRRLWQYDESGSKLTLESSTRGQTAHARSTAALVLHSSFGAANGGRIQHRANFAIEPRSGADLVSFKLPETAELAGVRLNGAPIDPDQIDGRFELPVLPLENWADLSIDYWTNADSGTLRTACAVAVPELSAEVLRFEWRLAMPPGAALASLSPDLNLQSPRAAPSWKERIFGPLGQTPDRPLFNPFDATAWLRRWEHLTGDRSGVAAPSIAEESQTARELVAVAPTVPQSLTVSYVDRDRWTFLAWAGMILCALAGLAIRMRRLTHFCRNSSVWLAICLVAAWFAPFPLAGVFGGCFVGSLIAVLVPRRLILPPSVKKVDREQLVPTGSTASYRHAPISIGLILIAISLVAAAQAQSPAVPSTPGSSRPVAPAAPASLAAVAETGAAASTLPARILLLVPGGSTGSASKQELPPVVYVERPTLAALRKLMAERELNARYLISTADYTGQLHPPGTVSLEARFRVYVLPGADPVDVRFPLREANPDLCQVDGRPHPLLLSSDSKHVSVELTVPQAREAPTGFDVYLRLNPPAVTNASGGAFKLMLPRICQSSISQQFEESYLSLGLLGALGEVRIARDRKALTAELGRTGSMELIWSATATPVRIPAALEARAFGLVTASSTHLDFRYRVSYRVVRGSVDFVKLQLPQIPQQAVLRTVAADGLLDYSVTQTAGRRSQLVVEFLSPRQQEFFVDVEFTLPLPGDSPVIRVPYPGLFGAGNARVENVEVLQDQIGILTESGFELSLASNEAEQATAISADAFLRNVGAAAGFKRPLLAFQYIQPAQLSFRIAPLEPHRQVRASQLIRVDESQIHWTLNAEVETLRAPAFEHVLELDERLKIESASVQKDNAERLVRWTRRGKRLQLLLSDKTTGIQDIVLKGTLPIVLDQPVGLPEVRFESANVTDSILQVFRSADVELELPPGEAALAPAGNPRNEGNGGASPAVAGKSDVLIGRFRLDLALPAPNVKVTLRSDSVATRSATLIERGADGDWRMATAVIVENAQRPLARLRLMIPSDIAETAQWQISGGAFETIEPGGDGSQAVEFRADADPDTERIVVVTAKIPASQIPATGWKLPEVRIENSAPGKNLLIIAPPDIADPAGTPFQAISPDALPVWLQRAPGWELPEGAVEVFERQGAGWQLQLRPSAVVAGGHLVPLLEQHVWLKSDGAISGRTLLAAFLHQSGPIDFQWPDEIQLVSVLANGDAVSAEKTPEGLLRVSGLEAGRGYLIALLWDVPVSRTAKLVLRAEDIPLPALDGQPADKTLLSLLPPDDVWLLSQSDLAPVLPMNYDLARLRALTELLKLELNAAETQPAIWQTVKEQSELLRRTLSARNLKQTGSGIPPEEELLEEIERLRPRLDLLPISENPSAAGLSRAVDRLALPEAAGERLPVRSVWARSGPGRDREAATLGTGLPVKLIGRPLMTWLLAACALLVVLPAFSLLDRAETSEWLHAHDAVAWGLLGAIWWACLTPSFIGLLLMTYAGWQGLRLWRAARTNRGTEVRTSSGQAVFGSK